MGGLLEGRPVYPHLKLTREEFPRVLATRVLRDDEDEYFGPFLTKTGVRLLMGFVHRTFKLRSCDIKIDGNFAVPCTQYFSKRCVAPCVAEICGRESYHEVVAAVRMFIANDRDEFRSFVHAKIAAAADALDFESAVEWRDRLIAVEEFWANKRWHPWVEDAVDTYSIAGSEGEIVVQLVTTRGRRMLGSLNVPFFADHFVPELLSEFIIEYYRFHLPREVRVPIALSDRKRVGDVLEERFGRRPMINVVRSGRTVTAERAFNKMGLDETLRQLGPRSFVSEVGQWRSFGLDREPRAIEAFDAAHISATSFSAGASVWRRGRVAPEEFEGWVSDQKSELGTLTAFAERRLASGEDLPDLVLVDGGLGQLRAVLKAAGSSNERTFRVVSAVKPRGKHSQISHFLTEKEERIDFDGSKRSHVLLQKLRDEAHDIANAAHRELREMRHFYAASGHEPLVVPIRFVEAGGQADDLRPIEPR